MQVHTARPFLFAVAALCLAATTACSQSKHATPTSSSASSPVPSPVPSPVAARSAVSGKGPGKPTVAHTLQDQGWGLPWGTVMLPPGWTMTGGVIHAGYQGCSALGDSPMFVAESPDHLYGIAVLPMLKTNASSGQQYMNILRQGHCPILASVKPADFLSKYILPQFHKDFRVISSGPEPQFAGMTSQLREMNAGFERMGSNSQYLQTHRNVDDARVLVTYEVDGHEVDEIASAILNCTTTTMHMVVAMRGFPAQTQNLECTAPNTVLLHAPNDGTPFNADALAKQANTKGDAFFEIKPNPAWAQRSNQESQRAGQQIAAQGQANLRATQQASQGAANNQQTEFEKQQAIRQGVSDYSRQVHNNVYQNQQAANTQVTGAYAAHMGDYNTYTNPNTGQQVQLSNQYNNTYLNANGNVALQTNSASSPGTDWTQMIPKY